jgi:hypothetical protein
MQEKLNAAVQCPSMQDELNALHLARQELEGKSKALETQLKTVTGWRAARPLTLTAPFRCGHASTFSVLNLVAGPHEEYFPAVDHGKSCPTTVDGCARDPSFPFVVCPVHASVDEAVQRGMHSVPAAQSERFEFPVRFICLQALQHAGQFSAIVHRYADA